MAEPALHTVYPLFAGKHLPDGSKRNLYNGEILNLSLSQGEALILRRASIMSVSGNYTQDALRQKLGWKSILQSCMGRPFAFQRIVATDDQVELNINRAYPGQFHMLKVYPEHRLRVSPHMLTGYRGDIVFSLVKSAKNDFLYLLEASGSGEIYLKFPNGKSEVLIDSEKSLHLNAGLIGAVEGDVQLTGEGLSEIKRWATSGQVDTVRAEGLGRIILSNGIMPDTEKSSSWMSMFDVFS